MLLLLPLAFALWYFTAAWHLAPVVWLSELILRSWMPDAVADLRLRGDALLLVTHFGEWGGGSWPIRRQAKTSDSSAIR
ncbi:MAG: hypothetical protein IPF57_04845 [Gammaproteobacteria bacterium]|nr:hypothetical protein [Gammaproteobacteria bacterium]